MGRVLSFDFVPLEKETDKPMRQSYDTYVKTKMVLAWDANWSTIAGVGSTGVRTCNSI